MSDSKVMKVQRIHAIAREVRGRFLNKVAVIERDLALILSKYFCGNDREKQRLFFERVACRMSLDQKREIVFEIIKRDFSFYWTDNVEVLGSLKKLQEFRNKLAHSVVDLSDEAIERPIEEGVGFVQWNEGAPISIEELDRWCAQANMVSGALSDVRKFFSH